MTGWNLPPGCTYADIERAFGETSPCDVCGNDAYDCICPECDTCGEFGNPECYVKHGMVLSKEQKISAMRAKIIDVEDDLSYRVMHLDDLKNQPTRVDPEITPQMIADDIKRTEEMIAKDENEIRTIRERIAVLERE